MMAASAGSDSPPSVDDSVNPFRPTADEAVDVVDAACVVPIRVGPAVGPLLPVRLLVVLVIVRAGSLVVAGRDSVAKKTACCSTTKKPSSTAWRRVVTAAWLARSTWGTAQIQLRMICFC